MAKVIGLLSFRIKETAYVFIQYTVAFKEITLRRDAINKLTIMADNQ